MSTHTRSYTNKFSTWNCATTAATDIYNSFFSSIKIIELLFYSSFFVNILIQMFFFVFFFCSKWIENYRTICSILIFVYILLCCFVTETYKIEQFQIEKENDNNQNNKNTINQQCSWLVYDFAIHSPTN